MSKNEDFSTHSYPVFETPLIATALAPDTGSHFKGFRIKNLLMLGIKAAALWTDIYCIATDGTALISVFIYDPLMRFVLRLTAELAGQLMYLVISPCPVIIGKTVFLITSLTANSAFTVLPLVLLIPDAVANSAPAAVPDMIGILYDTTSFTLTTVPLMSDDPAHDILSHRFFLPMHHHSYCTVKDTSVIDSSIGFISSSATTT